MLFFSVKFHRLEGRRCPGGTLAQPKDVNNSSYKFFFDQTISSFFGKNHEKIDTCTINRNRGKWNSDFMVDPKNQKI